MRMMVMLALLGGCERVGDISVDTAELNDDTASTATCDCEAGAAFGSVSGDCTGDVVVVGEVPADAVVQVWVCDASRCSEETAVFRSVPDVGVDFACAVGETYRVSWVTAPPS